MVVDIFLAALLGIVKLFVSVFQFDPAFLLQLDNAISFFINLLKGASWLLPMDIMILSLIAIFAADNWTTAVKFFKWVISLIPGIG